MNRDTQPPQHRLRLLRPDLRLEDGKFDGGPVQCLLHPVFENRILCNFTIGANLFGQVVISDVALNARHSRHFDRLLFYLCTLQNESGRRQLRDAQLSAPRSAAADPICEGGDVIGGEPGSRRHLRLAVMADGADEDGTLRVTGDDGGAAGSTFEEAVTVEEGDPAVLEVLVVAGEAAALEDGSDPAIKETGVFRQRFLRGRYGGGKETGGRKVHYFFSPMPNWLLALTTLPPVMMRSRTFSLWTSRPVSSLRVAMTFLVATSTISPVEE